MVACAKIIVFFGLFYCFLLVGQKHYKNRFFDDFEMLIFSFLVKKVKVNNLAMVGSITWPYFRPKFCTERWPGYWPYFFFTLFLLKLFFQKSHSPCRKKRIKKKKQKTQQKTIKNRKQMARLLTYDGQVIDLWWPGYWPYSIYIYAL